MSHEPIDTIDRTSYEPAHAQLVGILRWQIAAGVFSRGTTSIRNLALRALRRQPHDSTPEGIRAHLWLNSNPQD